MIQDLKNIIAWLKTIINKKFYIWVPLDVVDDIFIELNIISQIQNIEVNNKTLVEFRIIGTQTNKFSDLDLIQNQILEYIKNNYRNLGFFKYEIWTYSNWYEEKRPAILRNIIFYKITS